MTCKILIVGSNRNHDAVHTRQSGNLLLQGLLQQGIEWDIYFPDGSEKPMPNLQDYNAVLCWSYRVYRLPSYRKGAQQIESQAKALGIPVINSVANSLATHSTFLQIWGANGIRCARHQGFNDFDEINLQYPFIIRRDGVHRGQDVFLMHSPEQVRELIEARKKDIHQENFNLAIEFIDTSGEDGYYRKYRSYIIGQHIIPRHLFLSDHWLVNFGNLRHDERSLKEIQHFLKAGEQNKEDILKAAALTGSDIVALDYSINKEGKYIFWEANRHFLMAGDADPQNGIKRFMESTGLAPEEMKRLNEKTSHAFGQLVLQRIEA